MRKVNKEIMKNNRKVTRQYVLREDDQKTIITALRMYRESLDDTLENMNQFVDHADYSAIHSHQFDLYGLTHLMHEKILINVTSTIDSDEPDDSPLWGDDNKDEICVDFPDGWKMDMKILEVEPIKEEITIDQIVEMKKKITELWKEYHIGLSSLKILSIECNQMRDELDKRRKKEVIHA